VSGELPTGEERGTEVRTVFMVGILERGHHGHFVLLADLEDLLHQRKDLLVVYLLEVIDREAHVSSYTGVGGDMSTTTKIVVLAATVLVAFLPGPYAKYCLVAYIGFLCGMGLKSWVVRSRGVGDRAV
jgi:hypothetical protein